MSKDKVQRKLAKGEKTKDRFDELFSADESGIKQGKTLKSIIKEMKKASGENLIREPRHASLC